MHSNGSINRVFRAIQKAATGVCQVVSECAKGRGKTKSSKSKSSRKSRGAVDVLAGAVLLLMSWTAFAALPTGGQIVDLEMVEQLGTGVARIAAYYSTECFKFTENFTRITLPAAVLTRLGGKRVKRVFR